MKVVIPGGSGQIGTILARHFHHEGHEVVVLSRKRYSFPWQTVAWDGETLDHWVAALERADVLINLTGRTVNCRYTPKNRCEIWSSRSRSVRVLGQAIKTLASPPRIWLQAGTATIYAHRFDAANDESTGEIGGCEAGLPDTWRFSIDVARAWEGEFGLIKTPRTRKVLLRSAMTMSPDHNGIFDYLLWLVRSGIGGKAGSGKQYISWIHYLDFIRAIDFLIASDSISGIVNLASPTPLPNQDFMRLLREAVGKKIALPLPQSILELGAMFLRTETELVLKSRRVVSARLVDEGFRFEFANWADASRDLYQRWCKTRDS